MAKLVSKAILVLLMVGVCGITHAQAPSSSSQPSWEGGRFQLQGWQGSWPLINVLDEYAPCDFQLSLGGNWLRRDSTPTALHFLETDLRFVWENHLGFGTTYSLVGIWDNDFFGRVFMRRWIQAERVYGIVSWGNLSLTLGVGRSSYVGVAGNSSYSLFTLPDAGLEWRMGPGVLRATIGPAWIVSDEDSQRGPLIMGGATFALPW